MTISRKLYFTPDVFLFPLMIVLLMWLVYWVEIRFAVSFNDYGIRPQKVSGLIGVITGPFIHGSLQHLFNNSIPLMVLSTALFYFYRSIRWKVLILGILFTGIITWIIGRPSYHIGASGIVYLLASFLFFKGLFSKLYQLIALSFAVVFMYGSLLWYVFPIKEGVSWEGHLAGFLVGLIFALLYKTRDITLKKYEWEQENYDPTNDPFMQQFDDDGNFIIPNINKRMEDLEEMQNLTSTNNSVRFINYNYQKFTSSEEE